MTTDDTDLFCQSVMAMALVFVSTMSFAPAVDAQEAQVTPSNDDQAQSEASTDAKDKPETSGSSSVTTFDLIASEVGFGLGGAVLGGTVGGLSGLIGGGTFVLVNPDVRTQERAGRVLLGSVGVGAGIGVVTGLPFGVFVGGDRLGADGKQAWATVGSLLGAGAALTTWGLTLGQKKWLPARIAVIPLPLITSIACFELSRPPNDSLENEAAPLFSNSQSSSGPQVVPVVSTTGTTGVRGLQFGFVGRF